MIELERLEQQYVTTVTKLLYMTEFVILIEYVEVITPILYCTYSLAHDALDLPR